MGKSSPQVVDKTTNPYAPATGNLQDILNKSKSIANSGAFDPTFSANTTGGLDRLGQLGQQQSATAGAAGQIVPGAGQGYQVGSQALRDTASGSQIGSNTALPDWLQAANQQTAGAVDAQFSGAGRYGSGAQTTALTNAIANQNNQALSGQYNQDRTFQQNAANALTQQGFQGIGAAQASDQANQNSVNQQIAAGQGQDNMATQKRLAPVAATQFEASTSNPIAALGTNSTQTTTQQNNPWTTGIGLGVQGLSVANSIFSDERVKENIQSVGKTHDGQPIYSYNYKGSSTPTMGLLAQNVEKHRPNAVTETPDGVKMVDYGIATAGARRGPVKHKSGMGALAR